MGQDNVRALLNRVPLGNSQAYYTSTDTIALSDQNIIVDSTASAMTLTMPPVAEAKGMIYSIFMRSHGGADCTVTATDAEGWDGDYTLNSAGDGQLLFSDGAHWWSLATLS
jgi:hypothetical protein